MPKVYIRTIGRCCNKVVLLVSSSLSVQQGDEDDWFK
jgi:hypothetical protein